jgi:CHAD domain-containing protein
MAQKSAEPNQQDTSQPPPAHLAATAEAFNAAVAECAQNADADAVHRLRTGSRRLQAMVEATLRESASKALEEPARAWLRRLKQIRRAAGPVRDLDVHRKLLEQWVGKESPLPEAAAGSALHKQAAPLDAWLKSQRKRLGHDMQRQIRKRQQGLADGQAGFMEAIGHEPLTKGRSSRPVDAIALEDFVRATDAMPVLDAENLHEFRKATKKARYVAESAALGQTHSRVASALKRVQDAIGDWHDWVCLEEEAKKALGQDAPELLEFLEREVERHFASAIKTTLTMRGRLSGEWMASHGKRPAASVTIDDVGFASSL